MRSTSMGIMIAVGLAAASCVPPGRITSRDYNRFAIKAQEEGLWHEAEYRLRQALAETPHDARLHNNLAVTLEALGELSEAHAEYKEAVRLAPDNDVYQRNLAEFMTAHRWEFHEDETTAETAAGTEK